MTRSNTVVIKIMQLLKELSGNCKPKIYNRMLTNIEQKVIAARKKEP